MPRKRPYVLMPPTAIPADGGQLPASARSLTGNETLSFQVRFEEAESSVPAAAARNSRPLPLGLGLLLFLVVPSALGTVAGFHLAGQWAGDALTWSIAGGAAGFVFGGGCLLWDRRKG